MKLTLNNDDNHKNIFTNIFHLLKNWDTFITLHFTKNGISIKGMDNSHIALYNVNICCDWFSSYEFEEENFNITVNSMQFSNIISSSNDAKLLEIIYTSNNPDYLNINFKQEINNFYYEICLTDNDQETLDVPSTEYDFDFTINSKLLSDIINKISLMGDTLNICCDMENIYFNGSSSGETGKLKISVDTEKLENYSITEGEELDIDFSLKHISKLCLTTKLSESIDISASNDYPIKIQYNFDANKNNNVIFYIAPKTKD